ncbi:UV excision repair protein Rad23 [Microthyrium microscopicum]|uniref:UV excision repair protein RAD23 n=1 Tax=Microthyrium microscopicum TaxID=703497 RepID=A0A6A6UN37_9PEZI|nr:UV excision repair protein Rad23 [Microthyrium microscopicum]
MKLTFKDLKQAKFVIEAEPFETIAQVKAKIQQEKEWEPAQQKLIYSGKILQDDKTIESYNIEEKGFIVCMIQKPKPQPSTSAAPSTPAQSSTTSQTPAAPIAPVASTGASNVPATPSPAGAAQSPSRQSNDPSTLALGAERAAATENMEAMGFPRDQIDRAMRAAFFNPDRAVEYLLNGIPEHLQREQAPAAAATQAPAARAPAATTETATAPADLASDEPINLFEAAEALGRGGPRQGAGAAAGAGAGAGGAVPAGTLDFLRNNPQFHQLRTLVQQNPQMLEPIMQQLTQGNPQLAQMITNRPDEFLELLAEDEGDDAALPPGAQVVSITEEERDAIERLCRLGFERDLVIQAYFACDKNEELAANFLFDQPDDDQH